MSPLKQITNDQNNLRSGPIKLIRRENENEVPFIEKT